MANNPTTAPIMTSVPGPGGPYATPAYLVDIYGNPLFGGVALQGGVAPTSGTSGNAAALTANTDYTFKWGPSANSQVNHLMIQNNTALNVLFELDNVTSLGSPILQPGQTIFLDVQTLVLHLQANGTPNVNGSTAGNIVVRGWL